MSQDADSAGAAAGRLSEQRSAVWMSHTLEYGYEVIGLGW